LKGVLDADQFTVDVVLLAEYVDRLLIEKKKKNKFYRIVDDNISKGTGWNN